MRSFAIVGRVVEIASDGVHLSTHRGFMKVSKHQEALGQVALDLIDVLVVHGHGISYSSNLVSRLSERGVPLIFCGSNHAPNAMTIPLDGHHAQGFRMEAQAAATQPTKKRLWRDLIRAKISHQADVLSLYNRSSERLRRLAKHVKLGDSTNQEALAAQAYWPLLLGKGFRRDRTQKGANQLLNYGYMILRAATARSIVASGLHPSLSIFHQSRGTALRLSDDLMEPYRPFVDYIVKQLLDEGVGELTPDIKLRLAALTKLDLKRSSVISPLQICLDRTAQSLAQIYMKEAKSLDLPIKMATGEAAHSS